MKEVQTQLYCTTYQAETREGKAYVEDVCHAMKTLKPFMQKWGCMSTDYEQICQMAHEQMNKLDFYATWQLLTAWEKSNQADVCKSGSADWHTAGSNRLHHFCMSTLD